MRRVAAESEAVQSAVVLVLRRRRLFGDGVAVPPSWSPSERTSGGGLVFGSAGEKRIIRWFYNPLVKDYCERVFRVVEEEKGVRLLRSQRPQKIRERATCTAQLGHYPMQSWPIRTSLPPHDATVNNKLIKLLPSLACPSPSLWFLRLDSKLSHSYLLILLPPPLCVVRLEIPAAMVTEGLRRSFQNVCRKVGTRILHTE